jgi:hypothetical protein
MRHRTVSWWTGGEKPFCGLRFSASRGNSESGHCTAGAGPRVFFKFAGPGLQSRRLRLQAGCAKRQPPHVRHDSHNGQLPVLGVAFYTCMLTASRKTGPGSPLMAPYPLHWEEWLGPPVGGIATWTLHCNPATATVMINTHKITTT